MVQEAEKDDDEWILSRNGLVLRGLRECKDPEAKIGLTRCPGPGRQDPRLNGT